MYPINGAPLLAGATHWITTLELETTETTLVGADGMKPQTTVIICEYELYP